MSETKYFCSHCGEDHNEWPALTFTSPTSYNILSERMKAEIGELSGDFCVVRHPNQTDRFIKATVPIKVTDHCEDFECVVWVSLSEKSFEEYSANFSNSDHEGEYFGWLNYNIPEYKVSEDGIPTTVFTRKDGLRPEIVPRQKFDHQLVKDYYDGLTASETEKRIQTMLRSISDGIDKSKPWWKFW